MTKYCLICGAPFQIRPAQARLRSHCSRPCMAEAYRRAPRLSVEERLWAKVQKNAPDACWPWTGSCGSHGYGQLAIDHRPHIVTHLIWEQLRGAIPPGLWVLHTCDNRPCCNPDHLFLGTRMDNVQDMLRKQRETVHGQPRLTFEQRTEICTLYATGNFTYKALGHRYGVHRSRIGNLIRTSQGRGRNAHAALLMLLTPG